MAEENRISNWLTVRTRKQEARFRDWLVSQVKDQYGITWSDGSPVISNLPNSKYEDVTTKDMLSVLPIWCAVNFISRTIAELPLHVYERDGEETKRIESGLSRMLNTYVSTTHTRFKWLSEMMCDVLTKGRSISVLERDRSRRLRNIWIVDPTSVKVECQDGIGNNRRLIYHVKIGKDKVRKYRQDEVIDICFRSLDYGVTAISPYKHFSRFLTMAMRVEMYASTYFDRGGIPLAILTGPFDSKEGIANVFQSFNNAMKSGYADGSKVIPLPADHELKTVGFNPENSQLEMTRRFLVEEVGRMYQLPPTFLQDYTKGTYSNTEQQDIHLTKHTIAHWASMIEAELSMKIFGRRQSNRMVRFSLDELQRGDWSSRISGEAQSVQNGLRTINEVRESNDLPPIEGGDQVVIQQNMTPLSKLDSLIGERIDEGRSENGSD